MFTLFALSATHHCVAQEIDQAKLVRLKAAITFNLIKFTTWPESSFEDSTSPLVVGMIGEGPLIDVFQAAVAGRKIKGRAIQVRLVKYPTLASNATEQQRKDYRAAVNRIHADMRQCHMVYVSPESMSEWASLRQAVENHDVLVISNTPGFAKSQGTVELKLNNKRKRLMLCINMTVLERTQLKIRSQLMSLAQIIRTPEKSNTVSATKSEVPP